MIPPAPQQPIDGHDQHSHRHGKSPKLENYLRAMTKAGASGLHLKAGAVPHIRIGTEIRPVGAAPLGGDDILEMAMEVLTERQQAYFLEHGSIDLAHELPGGDRFRLNAYRQRGETSIAVRRVNREIPDLEKLHLPPAIARIVELRQGLILVCGTTASGKSTTIAAMIEHINRTRRCHVVTIEDPIEYLYQDKQALINQREIGIDVLNYADAMKHVVREDPDVIMIGDLRDRETLDAAIQAAEMGHLVFASLYSPGAAQTIGRILDLFPPDIRQHVRGSLALNIQAIICQKLLPSILAGVDRVPAVEILLVNTIARQLILEGRDAELPELIRIHERDGMQSFTRSLLELIQKEHVDPKVAYEAAPNAEELKMLMKGISASRPGFLGR